MRPIPLTNCDGKLFFTLVQRRLTKFMMKNEYINRSVQKAFMPGVSGCVAHNQLLWEVLKYAKASQLAICVSWLDLRNAYGSVRHNLIQFALWYYHFPTSVTNLIFHYYDGLTATAGQRRFFASRLVYSKAALCPRFCSASCSTCSMSG